MPMMDAAACAGAFAGADRHQPCTPRARSATPTGKDGVQRKADGSPVTAADIAAEAAIRDGLSRFLPPHCRSFPRNKPSTRGRVGGSSYFLVDPLDGTREFIAGRDEYTVNIALMTKGAPVLGVIAAPALGLIWRGIVGRGAERLAFAADGEILLAKSDPHAAAAAA